MDKISSEIKKLLVQYGLIQVSFKKTCTQRQISSLWIANPNWKQLHLICLLKFLHNFGLACAPLCIAVTQCQIAIVLRRQRLLSHVLIEENASKHASFRRQRLLSHVLIEENASNQGHVIIGMRFWSENHFILIVIIQDGM